MDDSATSRSTATHGPMLLYDGACALCNRAVTFVLTRDASGAARFAPLQGTTAAEVLARHPHLAGIDSMVWIDAEGRVWTRSDAALAIGRYLGGRWSAMASLSRIVPTVARDVVYDLIARMRYRVFGRYDACPPPRTEHRARFLP